MAALSSTRRVAWNRKVIYDRHLTASERLIGCVLAMADGLDWNMSITVARTEIAVAAGLSPRAVTNALGTLEQRGHISRSGENGRTLTITLL